MTHLAEKPHRPSPATKRLRELAFERAMLATLLELGAVPVSDGIYSGLSWTLANPYGPVTIAVRGINVFARFDEWPDDAARERLGLSRTCKKWNVHAFEYRDGGEELPDIISRLRWRFETLRDGLI